jgi:thiamine kinase
VLAHLDGPTLINRYARNPVGLMLGLRRLARLQAQINGQDAAGLPPLHELLRFQVEHARVSEAARHAARAALDRLPQGSGLCHGDLHPSNVICTKDGLVVIDWQKAAAGNPAADVARTLVVLRYGRLKTPPGLRRRLIQASRMLAAAWYVRCYARASGIGAAEIEAWQLPVLATKLTGPVAGNEAEVYDIVEALAAAQAA